MKGRHLFFFMAFCCTFSFQTHSQTKSGLILQGGSGVIKSVIEPANLESFVSLDINYKSDLSIGYRFQIKQPGKSIFFNLDANLGMKLWDSKYVFENPNDNNSDPYFHNLYRQESVFFYLASLTGTVNYSIYKGLNAGFGLAPTYLIKHTGTNNKNRFDMPVIAKLAYDFGSFEVGINYKYGLFNMIKTDILKSGKFRDIQLSLFIPF